MTAVSFGRVGIVRSGADDQRADAVLERGFELQQVIEKPSVLLWPLFSVRNVECLRLNRYTTDNLAVLTQPFQLLADLLFYRRLIFLEFHRRKPSMSPSW